MQSVHEHTASDQQPFWTLITALTTSADWGAPKSSDRPMARIEMAIKDLIFTIIPGHWIIPFIQQSPTQVDALMEFSRNCKASCRLASRKKN
jgi:hypothetical protein